MKKFLYVGFGLSVVLTAVMAVLILRTYNPATPGTSSALSSTKIDPVSGPQEIQAVELTILAAEDEIRAADGIIRAAEERIRAAEKQVPVDLAGIRAAQDEIRSAQDKMKSPRAQIQVALKRIQAAQKFKGE